MFSLCMVESGADEVNLRGVTSLGLKQALEFAYTGQVWYQMSPKRLNFTWPEEIILEEWGLGIFLVIHVHVKKKFFLHLITKIIERKVEHFDFKYDPGNIVF